MKLYQIYSSFAILGSALTVECFLLGAPHRASLQSSRPYASRCSSSQLARQPVPSLCSVAEPAVEEKVSVCTPEQLKDKLELAARLADKYSRDYAAFYVVPGRVSQNVELFRLITFFEWKVDAFADEFPEWKSFLAPGTPAMPELSETWSFRRRDVRKFGPIVDYMAEAQETYDEFVDAVEAEFGSDAGVLLKFLDKCIYMFIRYSDEISFLDNEVSNVETLKQRFSLEEYKYMRTWSGGVIPLASAFWFGREFPQDGTVEGVASATALVNDLYDYLRDVVSIKQLAVWHYFDDIEDAIDYVENYYYEVFDRCGPDLQEFLIYTMRYQQDIYANTIRGYDVEWYAKLNARFSRRMPEAQEAAKQEAAAKQQEALKQ